MNMSLWIWGLVPAAIGVVLLLWAVRGRKIDDHPRCRKCGYNLHALDRMDTPCPECGACVSSPRTIRIGSRKRRLKALALAIVLLVVTAPILSVKSYLAYSGTTWIEHAPYSVLRWQAKNADPAQRTQIVEELLERHQLGVVSDKQVTVFIEDTVAQLDRDHRNWDRSNDELLFHAAEQGNFMPSGLRDRTQVHRLDYVYDNPMVNEDARLLVLTSWPLSNADLLYAADKVLAYQADPALPWQPWLAIPLVEAQDRGILPEGKWLRYLRQAVEHAYTLEVRPIVRIGDPVPYRLLYDNVRIHDMRQMPHAVSVSTPAYRRDVLVARIAGMDKHGGISGTSRSLPSGRGSWGSSVTFSPEQWQSVTPGQYTFHLEIEIAFLNVWEDAETYQALTRFTKTYSAQTQIVGAHSTAIMGPVTALPDGSSSMRGIFEFDVIRLFEGPESWSYQGSMHIREALPIAIRAEIVAITSSGMEYNLGYLSVNAGEVVNNRMFAEFFPLPLPRDESVTLELRPSLDVALRAHSVEPFWGETIVIEDVPIQSRECRVGEVSPRVQSAGISFVSSRRPTDAGRRGL